MTLTPTITSERPGQKGTARQLDGRYEHDAKRHLEVPSNGDSHAPSHTCPYPTRCYTPDFDFDFDFESDEETASPRPLVPSGPILAGLDRPSPRVRFRSRVRISAGRRRRLSDGSPVSSSPSSSISAPLRTHYTGRDGWTPLGARVGSQRLRSSTLAPGRGEVANGGKGCPSADDWGVWEQDAQPSEIARYDADEHTRLMTPTTRHFYTSNQYPYDSYHQHHEEREWKEQLMDQVFGKWPERLLNRHWWWWHLEPVLCCLCYPDDEE